MGTRIHCLVSSLAGFVYLRSFAESPYDVHEVLISERLVELRLPISSEECRHLINEGFEVLVVAVCHANVLVFLVSEELYERLVCDGLGGLDLNCLLEDVSHRHRPCELILFDR